MIRPWRSAAAALAVTLGAAVVGVLGFAAPAAAHVTVDPGEAPQGGYARVAFRVPNESDTATTTKVEVVFPEDAPVASVSTMPVPGWTVKVERRRADPPLALHGSPVTEVVSKITWTAIGDAGIGPGEFQEFPVSLGPLPQTDRMVFKALQTYSDGNVVRWIEEPGDGGEVDHPAPVLALVVGETTSSAPAPIADGENAADKSAGTAGWRTTGIVAALAAGIAGLVLGALAFARSSRTS